MASSAQRVLRSNEAPEAPAKAAVDGVSGQEQGEASAWQDAELVEHGGSCSSKFEVGQVTIRLPLDYYPLPLLALTFSFVPYFILALLLVDVVLMRRFFSIYGVVLMAICTLTSEVLLKPLLKQPRPITTAVRHQDGSVKNGMPSGHVLNMQTLLVWFLLEVLRGVTPAVTTAPWALLLLALMPMVPWARWYNGDHTAMQVLVSLAAGTVFGFLAFGADYLFFPPTWRTVGFSTAALGPTAQLQSQAAVAATARLFDESGAARRHIGFLAPDTS